MIFSPPSYHTSTRINNNKKNITASVRRWTVISEGRATVAIVREVAASVLVWIKNARDEGAHRALGPSRRSVPVGRSGDTSRSFVFIAGFSRFFLKIFSEAREKPTKKKA